MIRALERDDLEDVASLYHLVMRSGVGVPPRFLEPFFRRTLFDHPWADPEIPSLAFVDESRLLGFLGSNVRRMTFDGRPIRVGCAAHLVTHPSVRDTAVGPQLVRRYLGGPQELTMTDGASETVRRMWEALRGQTVHAACFVFVIVLRPWQFLREIGLGGRFGRRGEVLSVSMMRALDVATGPIAGNVLALPERPSTRVEELTPSAVLEHLPGLEGRRLLPDYDASYLSWLFAEVDRLQQWGSLWPRGIRRGGLFAQLVTSNDRIEGWYVCNLRPGGICRVVQIAARKRSAGAVIDTLVHEALRSGAAAVYGRMEPDLVGPLSERRCLVRYGGGRMVVHSNAREIVDAIVSGEALLTRLDGEWW